MPRAKRTGKYRSKFESRVAAQAATDGIRVTYEPKKRKLKWQPKVKTYLPDFELKNGVLVEAKGRFTSADRSKMLAVKQQNPTADLRLVFQRDNTLTKISTTLYSQWAETNGFPWSIGAIPKSWNTPKRR